MAHEPIDTRQRPSMTSVTCGGGCGGYIVVDRAYLDAGGTGYCSTCAHERIGGASGPTTYPPPPHWFSINNPPPTDPHYPPSPTDAYTIRVSNPDVAARCTAHPVNHPDGVVNLMSLNPDDIAVAFAAHDHIRHNTTGGPWLIAGDTGLTGDVCDPCGGGVYNKTIGKSVPLEGGPRHDLCYSGRTRGRGNDCPCTHDKTWMHGIKPGDRDRTGAVERLRADLERRRAATATNPPPPTITAPAQGYLFDPEEDTDHDQDT